jgi:nucleotide-binding universal stress UspA family protein
MAHIRSGPVVVGVDGSAQGLAASELGAIEAAVRGLPLLLVHAIPWPMVDYPLGPQLGGAHEQAEREQGILKIGEARERAWSVAPDLDIRSSIELGSPADLLLRSADPAMIVVGAEAHVGAATSLLGSTATQVALHATCPVVVSRGHERAAGDVVVGVDGSRASEAAIDFAFEEASLRGCGLTALHAWSHPMALGPADMLSLVDKSRQEDEQRVLTEALAGWSEKRPEVTVTRVVSRSSAKAALADASRRAQLVVVGARGRGGFAGLLMGSVGLCLLRASACPIAIVRPA